jgi:outer membrane protein OmpA-like peptidoglycan-associated protein
LRQKRRLIVNLGCAIVLAAPLDGVMAQERPSSQNERRQNETPQRPDEGKPGDDTGKAKKKDERAPKGPENKPTPELTTTPEVKPAPKAQPPAPAPAAPKAQKEAPPSKDPGKDAPAKPPASPAPEKRAPVETDKRKPTPAAPAAQTDVKPAPNDTRPSGSPVKGRKEPPDALPNAQKDGPLTPSTKQDIGKPGPVPNSDTTPPAPVDKSAGPAAPPAPAVPAPTTAPAAPATPAQQQAAPQKPAVLNPTTAPLPVAPLPPAPGNPAAAKAFQPGFQPAGAPPQKLQDVQKGRTERVEDGGKRTIIQEIDNRVIIKQDNRTIIRHDETQRFAKNATDVRSERRADGTTQTIIVQPGGIQIFNIVDNSGRTVRRYRRDERGREVNIIDNRSFYAGGGAALAVGLVVGAVALALRPPEIRIPREKYVVEYDRASDDDIYETLTAPPVERLERRYSLEEVRFSHELRERMRRLDLDTVTFEFGSWEVSSAQFSKLERVANVIDRILRDKPDEVFLVEGHTDAVGSDIDNLTLSDRRAQAVAEILTGVFRVPAENLVTQGYGEQYLKVATQNAEQANRRVAVRRITPLMANN